jgi:hypothetical protein
MKENYQSLLRYKVAGDQTYIDGMYALPHPKITGYILHVVASAGLGWDHVSVTLLDNRRGKIQLIDKVQRCPTWEEMCIVKDMFFGEDETVLQYHPPKSEYVNVHPYCLHLWRPHDFEIPVPEKILV